MEKNILTTLTRLSDTELVARLKSLVGREQHATAEVVAHLAELDTRDIHLREGYSSLFAYCREVLHFSEDEAGNRIAVARAARRFPVILALLAAGDVHLTAVRLLAPHLTPDNHREVLAAARGKRKVEVEEIVARLAPRPDVPTSVRKLPVPLLPALAMPTPPALAVPPPPAADPPPPPSPVPRAAVKPLSPDRYKYQVTIPGDTLEKLRLARDMLGHALPSGDDAVLLDRAITALLAELARKKFADTARPRRSRGPKDPSDPSAAVKRLVWVWDLGRCTYAGTNGRRCNERRFVQFHHLDPRALRGEATVELITLRCRPHNDYEGRLYFGKRRRTDGGSLVREEQAPYVSPFEVARTRSGTYTPPPPEPPTGRVKRHDDGAHSMKVRKTAVPPS